MKATEKKPIEEYTKEDFFKDLKKVCQPIKKSDKHKPSSDKT